MEISSWSSWFETFFLNQLEKGIFNGLNVSVSVPYNMSKEYWEELRGLADDDETTVRDPYHSKSSTCHVGVESKPESCLSWMKLCSNDNNYATMPQI